MLNIKNIKMFNHYFCFSKTSIFVVLQKKKIIFIQSSHDQRLSGFLGKLILQKFKKKEMFQNTKYKSNKHWHKGGGGKIF